MEIYYTTLCIMIYIYVGLLCMALSEATTFISLGDSCLPAIALRTAGLRNAAYPFDWIISPHRSIITNLSTNFTSFLDAQLLRIDPSFKFAVINTNTGNRFAHDFPIKNAQGKLIAVVANDDQGTIGVIHPDYLKHLPLIRQKYARRIKRFHETISSGELIVFLRHITTLDEARLLGIMDVEKNMPQNILEEAQEIVALMQRIIPHENWVIVIIGNHEILKNGYSDKHIETYYIPTQNFFPPRWNTASHYWRELFNKFIE